MKNTWEINFNGSNIDFEKTLHNFFDKIKEEVRESVKSSGKKYFNFKDFCILQSLKVVNNDNIHTFSTEWSDHLGTSELHEIIIVARSMAEYSVTFAYNYSSESFDESYDSGVKDFIKDIMQYCSHYRYFVHSVEIKFFFMDNSENNIYNLGFNLGYISDSYSDCDSGIDSDSDCKQK